MDMAMKTRFVESLNRDFSGAELPISFYYANAEMPRSGCLLLQHTCA